MFQHLHLTWLPSLSAMCAAVRRIRTGCETSPASFPTRSTSALAGAVAVTGTETLVLVLHKSGAPAGLTRVRSATRCDVSLDVVSWLGAAVAVVAVSGSSGGLTCTLGIDPIRRGSRSLRTFSGLPRVSGVGFHGSQTRAFKRVLSQRRLSPLSMHGFDPCHSVFRSSAHLFRCHVRAKRPRAMLVPIV